VDSERDAGGALHRAFVAAYRPFVERRLAEIGRGPWREMNAALDQGERWLDVELRRLLGLGFAEQRGAPLEIFREAMLFPTEVLLAAGATPVPRDPEMESVLPGDHFGLSPGSSQDLGEEAWRAHLAWGAAKARSVVRPVVGLLAADISDGELFEGPVTEAGFRLVVWDGLGAATAAVGARRPVVALVDLGHPGADDAIRALSDAGTRVIAYGTEVDDLIALRARALGAADAVARSALVTGLSDQLPTLT
jgi:hypothetical protein